ncbi:MAG: transcription factor [Candidatus Eisenbacteria bacterium]|nr:transcription factor [Candidatus Eisenbacteria bacterium]MCC7142021.1 transcription factor [Candidatus Eisenbacteria bacterium]
MARWLDVDPEVFRAHFNKKPFFIRHTLANHPLFSLDRLVKLSQDLPPSYVEWRAGGLNVDQDPALTPMNGLSAEETLRQISENRSYLILKWVEHDPEYRRLLDECLDQLAEHSEPLYPGMWKRAAFIFISSPNDTVPYHMDHEHNFLLQVRGHKVVRQWDPDDRFILTDREIEDHYANFKHRNMRYREEFGPTAWTLPLPTGQGLHFPVCAPHWIQNGDEASISFSITFRSRWTRRRELLYHANANLRKRGFKPSPVGENPLEDIWKLSLMQTASFVRRLAGKSQVEKRQY